MSRLTWDQTWLNVALVIAQRSRCSRSQAGCVLVTSDNQVVSASYNGPPAGMDVEGDCSSWCPRGAVPTEETRSLSNYDDCVAAHAETNGIAFADRSRLAGGTAYTTRVPCMGCTKVLANSGIAQLVYRADAQEDQRGEEHTRQVAQSLWLLEKSGVRCVGLRCDDREIA